MQAQSQAPLSFGGAAPDKARMGLVLVHGRGGSARDILGLGEALGLPDVACVAPEAPGHSWWPTSFLAPMAEMQPFLDAGLASVAAAVAALEDAGLARDRIAVAGFSQGGCLALEYGARNPGLAGVFGLSAGLVGTADAGGAPDPALYGFADKRLDYDGDLTGTPVTITVHEADPHIPLKRARDSAAAFRAMGADAGLEVTPGAGHGITQAGVTRLRAVLNR